MTKKHRPEQLDPEVPPAMDPETGPDQAVSGSAENEGSPSPDDEGGEEEGLAREFENLAAAVEQKTKEASEANEKYLRTYADFENYRKRMQRDQAEFRKYANEQLALELLTVIDHLALALKHAGGSGEGLQQGVEMVYKQFRDVLEKFGIKSFKAEGEPFDPAIHEAMMQVETADVPENTVVQVFQDGFLYHEKVLRHAKVGVSKKPSSGTPAPAAVNTDDEDTDD